MVMASPIALGLGAAPLEVSVDASLYDYGAIRSEGKAVIGWGAGTLSDSDHQRRQHVLQTDGGGSIARYMCDLLLCKEGVAF